MIDRVQIGAWRNSDEVWTVRVSYADTEDGNLFPPCRFWRSSKGPGPGPAESIAEALYFVMGELSNINYGPDMHGEPDPTDQHYKGASYAPWAEVELE